MDDDFSVGYADAFEDDYDCEEDDYDCEEDEPVNESSTCPCHDPDRFGPPLYMIGKYYADGSVNTNYKGSGSLNGEDRSCDVDPVKFENCFIRFSDVIDCLEANTSVHCAIEDMKLSLIDFSGKYEE
jgi:hypothetical protein